MNVALENKRGHPIEVKVPQNSHSPLPPGKTAVYEAIISSIWHVEMTDWC